MAGTLKSYQHTGENRMSVLEIVLIAVGLSMDAFAVSITLGLSVTKPKAKEILLPGIYFGFFQALMPTIGFFAGTYFADKIQSFDHWLAFALLAVIGGKMIKDSLSKKEEERINKNVFQFVKMLVLAVATSIDALAIGITFAIFNVNILRAALITGLITFFVSMAGVKTGNIFGTKFKSKAECAGGSVLVLLGIKIIIEHVFLNN
ncbi:MAG: manganese efflux pump MntP family protein [Spirochaetaceae bacterium]|nr:manganese efflux pump MntP family protein [Spirochaetaceae bacterium]